MKYDTKMKLSALVVVGVCAAILAAVFFASRAGDERGRAPNCYETPSAADVGRTLELVPGPNTNGGRAIYACSLYSRPAMPDVIRCYELNRGCSP